MPVERYRVGLINAGTYRAVYDQAAMDLGGLGEVGLVTGSELDSILASASVSEKKLIEARSVDELDAIKSLDFIIVLLPAPAAYPTGAVAVHSINWRAKTIVSIPGMAVPKQPHEWLLSCNNGWVRFSSEPTGAKVWVGQKFIGTTPLLVMMESQKFEASFEWTPKYKGTAVVDLSQRNWVHARAPEEYLLKHQDRGLYARMQAADEKHGDVVFIIFYTVAIIASVALLFYNPF